MARWILFAGLSAVVALIVAHEDRSYLGDCRAYPIMKSFTVDRITSNDSCTFSLPSFQCGGFCETKAEINSRGVIRQPNGMYELVPRANCKCCEPIPSTMEEKTIPAGTLPCEGSELRWDKKIIVHSIGNCTCRKCRSSSVVWG